MMLPAPRTSTLLRQGAQQVIRRLDDLSRVAKVDIAAK